MNEIDLETIEKMMELLAEDYTEIVNSFLSNTDRYIERIGLAIAQGNEGEIASVAHQLTSSAGQMGLIAIQHLAKAIEYETDNEKRLAQHEALRKASSGARAYFRQQGLDC